MTDIPIIFSGLMVKALLAGHKTMTRRLATRIKIVTNPKNGHFVRTETAPTTWQNVKPGDRLWVRENLDRAQGNFLGIKQNVFEAIYAADKAEVLNEDEFNLLPWWKGKGGLPSIHMPRWASRLTLTVTSKKIEPVQDITMEDMIAEGLSFRPRAKAEHIMAAALRVSDELTPKWEALWRKLHGDKSWEANPEVVAIGFTVQEKNIDAMEKAV